MNKGDSMLIGIFNSKEFEFLRQAGESIASKLIAVALFVEQFPDGVIKAAKETEYQGGTMSFCRFLDTGVPGL